MLKALEPFLQGNPKLFKVSEPGSWLLKLVDIDPQSDFHFTIQDYKIQNDSFVILVIDRKPRDQNDVKSFNDRIAADQLKLIFENWLSYLEEYQNITAFEDPLLKQYEREFEEEFDIMDEDADTTSYNLQVQLLIDEYLGNCQTRLEMFKNRENEKEIEAILQEVKDLKVEQTRLPKRKVVKALAKIWAKTRKLGLELLKDIYNSVKDDLIKRLITGKIDDLLS